MILISITSSNSSVLHVEQHLGNAHSQQCPHLLLYFLECQEQVCSNRHTLQHTYLRTSLCTCVRARVDGGRWPIFVYYVYIKIPQETLSHFPVSHTTLFETFKIHTFFPNMTTGLVWFLNAVWWSQIKKSVRLRKGPCNGIDPDNGMKEPARRLPSN